MEADEANGVIWHMWWGTTVIHIVFGGKARRKQTSWKICS
jgi:hypothetical protein